jgi:hypothetical protein
MTTIMETRAEALFASSVQSSEAPTSARVQAVIAETLARLGVGGCAARMAEEYGDHPTEAARRMIWVLAALRAAFPDPELSS